MGPLVATVAVLLANLAAQRLAPSAHLAIGLVTALLERRYSAVVATVTSSVLFGLWHILPALGSNTGPGGAGIRVAGTVLATGLAGLGFCWLRARSGSLLAPALLHWALNGLGLLAARAA
jgi:membrane protease YdiL (CAAX protease family)